MVILTSLAVLYSMFAIFSLPKFVVLVPVLCNFLSNVTPLYKRVSIAHRHVDEDHISSLIRERTPNEIYELFEDQSVCGLDSAAQPKDNRS